MVNFFRTTTSTVPRLFHDFPGLESSSFKFKDFLVSVAVAVAVAVPLAVPMASWGTTAAIRVPRLRIGERPREWTRG